MASLPYDPKGFPDDAEELHILQRACLDAFGPCGQEVPVELQRALTRLRVALVGRAHLTTMAAAAARAHEHDHRFGSLTERVSELERKRVASGRHIVDLHRKLAKLKQQKNA